MKSWLFSGVGWLFLGLLAGLSGCVRWWAPAPLAREEFAFQLEPPVRAPALTGPTLNIRLFEAAPAIENQEFLYRLSSLRWQTDYYHVFTQPPATLITFELRRWMAQSGLFRSVSLPGLGPGTAWQLQGYVAQLYGDFRHPARPEAVLHLRCVLLAPGLHLPPVLAKTYRQNVPLQVNTPVGLVEAWNLALERIFVELTTDIAQALRRPLPAPAPTPGSASPHLFPIRPNPTSNLAAPSAVPDSSPPSP